MQKSELRISDIELMQEDDLRRLFAPDFEVITVKGFQCYLVDFTGYFGYSMIVFGEGKQIRWADDFELHHKGKTHDELRTLFIQKAERVLFTEEELAEPLKSYNDFELRRKFISELLPLKRDFLSMFHISRTEEEKAARAAEEAKHPVFCSAAYGFFTEADNGYAEHLTDMYIQLCNQLEDVKNNYEYQFSAFYYELGNHEYHINTYQGDWDTLSAFGNIPWRGQGAEAREKYFDDLNFTEVQRKAFNDARAKYLKDADENDWY